MTITGDHEFVPPDLQRRLGQLETDLAKLRNSVGKLGLSRQGGSLLVPGGITIGSGLGGGGVAAAGSGASLSATIPGAVGLVDVATHGDAGGVWIDFTLTYPTNAGQAQLQYFEVWHRRTGDAAWSSTHVNGLKFKVGPVQPVTQYDFQVRYVTNLGQVGPWGGGQITTTSGPWLGAVLINPDVDDGAWAQFSPDFTLFSAGDFDNGFGGYTRQCRYRIHDHVCEGEFLWQPASFWGPGTSPFPGTFYDRYCIQAPARPEFSGAHMLGDPSVYPVGVSWVQPQVGKAMKGHLIITSAALTLGWSFSHVFDAATAGTEEYFGSSTPLGLDVGPGLGLVGGVWYGWFMYETHQVEPPLGGQAVDS